MRCLKKFNSLLDLKVKDYIKSVKCYHRLTSVVLVFILFFVLGVEALNSKESRAIACSEVSSTTDCSSFEQESHVESGKSMSPCSDPCHIGIAHFGHCFYNTVQTSVSYFTDPYVETKNIWSQLAIQGPVLEAPRKPPRLS